VSSLPTGPGETDTRDGDLLADLFDTLLQEILDGNTPDLASYYPDRPDLRERIAKTWALACSVAGRREPSRPVLGGYEIVRELGHGGMGTVYLARHQALQREVAIKVLPHSLAMSPRAKQRFLEEAKALARLRHDHVVHIHRIIDHAEMLAFEMEFVDGPSLQTLILELRQQPKPHSIESARRSARCRPGGARHAQQRRVVRALEHPDRPRTRRSAPPRTRASRRQAVQHPAAQATAGRCSPTSASPASATSMLRRRRVSPALRSTPRPNACAAAMPTSTRAPTSTASASRSTKR
jgi:hypothetical protein